MDNVSQLLLRNHPQLPETVTDLVGAAPDALFRELTTPERPVTPRTDRFSVYRALSRLGADARFEPWADDDVEPGCVILVLPREKARLGMRLHEAASRLQPGGRLFLAGPNRAGIKSSPRLLSDHFSTVEKRDSARHCTLFEASEPVRQEPFCPGRYERTWTLETPVGPVRVSSLPGVFAHGRLDDGTALLLEALQATRPAGRILDFACGAGVIGMAVLALDPESQVTFLDDSALALASTRRSLELNGLQGDILPSNGLGEVTDRYDWIVSNPPFHQGVSNDLDVARRFFREAGTFLNENGRILVVFNRHLPYEGWLRESFIQVECLVRNRGFTVLSARNGK